MILGTEAGKLEKCCTQNDCQKDGKLFRSFLKAFVKLSRVQAMNILFPCSLFKAIRWTFQVARSKKLQKQTDVLPVDCPTCNTAADIILLLVTTAGFSFLGKFISFARWRSWFSLFSLHENCKNIFAERDEELLKHVEARNSMASYR